MVLLQQLMVRGVRSVGPSEEETQVIRFLNPLTIISGPNGSGKTTLIEALNYITTGALPPGKLASFVHSVEASHKARVDGMVKLQFTDCKGRVCVATKRVNATLKKDGKLQCKSDEFNIQVTTPDGQVGSLSSKVADFQKEVTSIELNLKFPLKCNSFSIVNLLGVPAAILDNVIFCHQEDSDWPLSEPKELKQRFDRIFQLTRFVKALEVMKKMRKDYESELATLVEKQNCKEMVVKSKGKYIQQRDSCEQLRKESLEKIEGLGKKIEDCNSVIKETNDQLLKLEALERKAELKRAELRMLTDQLHTIRVSPYPGTEEELRAEIQEMDSSSEFRELETQREKLKKKIESICKDITILKTEKDEAEAEMRRMMSCEMVRRDLQKEVEAAESELVNIYALTGPDYRSELQEKIEENEHEMKELKASSAAIREERQARLDEAQMEFSKMKCELDAASSSVEMLAREMRNVERKLKDAAVSTNEIDELSGKISELETKLSVLPGIDEKRSELLKKERNLLQKELESLRKTYADAEEFEETEREVERKSRKKDELENELNGLLKKHNTAFIAVFGKETKGPWSASVNALVKTREEANRNAENNLRSCERDLDRASQSLKQSRAEEEGLLNEVEQLRSKITDLCGCSPKDVAENLSETRHLLSKSRKELSSLSTKAMLYESWSEETKKRSCCPLCERKFTSKAGANELSGKLLDMSLSMPDDIERLEKQVAEAEEKERRLASAVVYVDQCKKIMEEKVRNVRKQISSCCKEEASLTTKVEELRSTMEEALNSHEHLLEIKSDVSLMDSLYTSVQTLDSELTELQEGLKRLPHTRSLAEMKKDLNEKEDSVVALNAELEEIQSTVTERNKLTTEMQVLKERRIALGELAAQTTHLRETLARHREDYEKLTIRRDEIMKKELPFAKDAFNEAKSARDTAERCAKEQEEMKLSESRAICNHYTAYNTLRDRLSKASAAAEEGQIESLKNLIKERDQCIIDLEKRKAGFELGVNDLESTHVKRRTLEDQLTRFLIEGKIASIEKELKDMAWNAEEKEAISKKRVEATRDRDRSSLEKARINGQLEEVEKKIKEAKLALASKEMKQAEKLYHDVVVDRIVMQETITDLEKYTQCLDTSIIQFHTEKMTAINNILDGLWRRVYGGNDIQTIRIKSECVTSAEKRKAYDYRVVMVLNNDVELDMRDRCSAGQKMLACILIRIALADVFGGMCSIIALDEPTTNLDAAKVEHIAAMLNSLIAVRRRGYATADGQRKPFQMIVITHDDHLVDKLTIGSKPEFIYVLEKDSSGVSHVKRLYSDGRSEDTNSYYND